MKKAILLLALLLITLPAYAKTITLSWDSSPTTSVIGYKLYVANDSQMESASVIDVGNALEYKAENLSSDEVHYFAVTAYDSRGNESVFSNIVESLPCIKPEAPGSLNVSSDRCVNISINIQ
jgi:fibronectin type 3 domain-containing protein